MDIKIPVLAGGQVEGLGLTLGGVAPGYRNEKEVDGRAAVRAVAVVVTYIRLSFPCHPALVYRGERFRW